MTITWCETEVPRRSLTLRHYTSFIAGQPSSHFITQSIYPVIRKSSPTSKMARFDSWFRTYVLAVFPSRRSKRGLTKEEMNISAPLPETVRHHSPVPYMPRSISAVDLPSEPEPTFQTMHTRRNSDDAGPSPRRLTVHFHEPPPTSFPTELPARSDSTSTANNSLTSSPASPSNRLSKRFSQFGTATREVMASQSAGNPRPVSIFAPGFDISIADMMPIHDDINAKQQRQVKRMSTLNVMKSIENEQRRESRRMSRRMTQGFDMYQARP
ncbi:hypothetical protein K458DRAFT_39651 [Lentithecium fluviatile CBS 122367]|uniref:Uncharacterized protein n=1 Tax=Lentithecium fluviatile CBS 122367 TaxID=1168545 RepID=A0A6G1IZR3_9PLEO|nr:hypothetical protein K458DRAFT_39651 [Lentithecium fluviatile CBS 122367]